MGEVKVEIFFSRGVQGEVKVRQGDFLFVRVCGPYYRFPESREPGSHGRPAGLTLFRF